MGTATLRDDRVELALGDSSAVVALHGATLLSWVISSKHLLFLSSKALTDASRPIRGGVPLVFPQFGPGGPLPQHGFARVSRWSWGGILKESANELQVSFTLGPDAIPPAQRAIWSHGRTRHHLALFVYMCLTNGKTLN